MDDEALLKLFDGSAVWEVGNFLPKVAFWHANRPCNAA
jgi:hypothetical protein